MSFILDIIMHQNDIQRLEIFEELIHWGEEEFSQDPPRFSYKSRIHLHKNMDNYYKHSIKDFDDNTIVLTLDLQQLKEFEFCINSIDDGKNGDDMLDFLDVVYTNSDWIYIFMYRDEEYIDNKYIITDTNEFIERISIALNWSSPEGIIVTKVELE